MTTSTATADFTATSLRGTEVSLSDFAGQVMLIVNTASKCGLTPQFEGLEELYRAHRDQGFTVLGFPCNQFGEQEPGTADEIAEFCQLNYGVSFPMFAKIEVNGEQTHPLFSWLKSERPGDIRWNFTKFLIGRDGRVIERFEPLTKPEEIDAQVRQALAG